jgi:hypothetical protein
MRRILTCALILGAATASTLLAEPMETLEIAFQCGGVTVRVNPVTFAADVSYPGSVARFRSRSSVGQHSIEVVTATGTMRINRDTNTFTFITPTPAHEPGTYVGACRDLLHR